MNLWIIASIIVWTFLLSYLIKKRGYKFALKITGVSFLILGIGLFFVFNYWSFFIYPPSFNGTPAVYTLYGSEKETQDMLNTIPPKMLEGVRRIMIMKEMNFLFRVSSQKDRTTYGNFDIYTKDIQLLYVNKTEEVVGYSMKCYLFHELAHNWFAGKFSIEEKYQWKQIWESTERVSEYDEYSNDYEEGFSEAVRVYFCNRNLPKEKEDFVREKLE